MTLDDYIEFHGDYCDGSDQEALEDVQMAADEVGVDLDDDQAREIADVLCSNGWNYNGAELGEGEVDEWREHADPPEEIIRRRFPVLVGRAREGHRTPPPCAVPARRPIARAPRTRRMVVRRRASTRAGPDDPSSSSSRLVRPGVPGAGFRVPALARGPSSRGPPSRCARWRASRFPIQDGGSTDVLAVKPTTGSPPKLERVTFRTSRMADFFSEKELTAQIGHPRGFWPLVVLKELVDNALDACEEVGVAPSIKVVLSDDRIEVADNGPGIPRETVAGMLDFSVRVSSREAYVSPTRGAQGNALKTIVAIPYVVDGNGGDVEIESRGVRHLISVSFDRIRQEPVISHETNPIPVTKGTRIRVGWPNLASTLEQWDEPLFLQVAEEYAFLNPHLTLDATCLGDRRGWEASNPGWARYRPSDPTSPHWYRTQDLERLIGAYVVHDPAKTVRAFVAEFKGLTSTVKGKAVLERTGLSRTKLADLVVDGELDHRVVADLLTAMRDKARPVSPSALGVIGRDHLARQLDVCGAMPESIQYRKSMGEAGGLPWLVEVAFGFRPDRDGRHLVSGVNFSPGILNPFRELGRGSGLDGLLAKLYSRHDDPVCWVAHLASPRVSYTDRGKSSVALTELTAAANAMVADIESAGKKWAKQRRAEIRSRGAELRRRQRFTRSKTSIKDAVFRVLPAAYERAAGSVRKAHQRQIYYPVRSLVYEVLSEENGEVEELTSKWFFDCLDEYMTLHPDVTADWDVLKDARGSFHEPHTGRRVPLGTLGVRGYLDEIDQHEVAHPSATEIPNDYPTLGPTNRFGAVLFIEKEGFHEILNAAQISERYDVAIMSTKGMSTFAARDLKSALGVPVLVARDFDKAGFSIAATLAPDVIDIGLRLEDVEECALESEGVHYGHDPRPNLRANGATEAEIAFLGGPGWGQRVELNAFTSDEFIAWLEEKFEEHGVRKVVPGEPTLADAYRRAVQLQHLNEMVRSSYDELERVADAAGVPPDLEQQVLARIEVNPSLSWDAAIAEIVGGAE